IKLRDYISRYAWNIYRYPSQYIRLKQENWQKLYQLWLESDHEREMETPEEQASVFSKWLPFLRKSRVADNDIKIKEEPYPKTENGLKQHFLNKLFPVQLKWASSTVTDVSFIDKHYYEDKVLKYFLQRFPDTYLVLYYPIFLIKNAPVDGDIILISSTGIEIIHLLERDPSVTIVAGD